MPMCFPKAVMFIPMAFLDIFWKNHVASIDLLAAVAFRRKALSSREFVRLIQDSKRVVLL